MPTPGLEFPELTYGVVQLGEVGIDVSSATSGHPSTNPSDDPFGGG